MVQINHSTVMEDIYLLPEYQNEYGGGYSQDIKIIIEAHANTFRLAQDIFF